MATYTYSVFDANPNETGGSVWPHHCQREIEADDDSKAVYEVRTILEECGSTCRPEDGYEVGQKLYSYVWSDDHVIVGEPTYTLTAEDLGVEGKDHVEEWETVASYVATFEDGACDVNVQIGQGLDGNWYLRTSDDAGGDDYCDVTGYDSREDAEGAAEEFADKHNEADEGEDAEDYLQRQLEETAGDPDPEGEYCVYWDTALEDSGPGKRYASPEAATAAAELANNRLHENNPGGNLLCGYEPRRLQEGKWVRLED
jgi:hypothetical protein